MPIETITKPDNTTTYKIHSELSTAAWLHREEYTDRRVAEADLHAAWAEAGHHAYRLVLEIITLHGADVDDDHEREELHEVEQARLRELRDLIYQLVTEGPIALTAETGEDGHGLVIDGEQVTHLIEHLAAFASKRTHKLHKEQREAAAAAKEQREQAVYRLTHPWFGDAVGKELGPKVATAKPVDPRVADARLAVSMRAYKTPEWEAVDEAFQRGETPDDAAVARLERVYRRIVREEIKTHGKPVPATSRKVAPKTVAARRAVRK